MKHNLLIVAYIVFYLFYLNDICYGLEEKEFDVRNVKWGMTKKEVINSEKSSNLLKNEKDSLMYKDRIFDHTAVISYIFNDKKLTSVMILLTGFDTPDEIADLYLKSKDMLKNKYKLTSSENEKVGAVSKFESDRSSILLAASNPDNKLTLFFVYGDKIYMRKNKKDKAEKFVEESKKF